MKKGIFNALKITAVFAVFGISNINAQQHPSENAMALKVYFQTNVSPQLKSARESFSEELTQEEKSEIMAARAEIKSGRIKKETLGLTKPYRELLKEDLTDDQIAFLNASRQQKIALYFKMKEISANHKESLEQIFSNKKELEKWQNDMVEIIKKDNNNRFIALNPLVKSNLKRMMPWDDIRNVLFLLWSPDEPILNI